MLLIWPTSVVHICGSSIECFDPGYGCLCLPANSNPCEHAGKCVNTDGAFHCECLKGYAGPRCEMDINECHSDPCKNDATCLDKIGGFTCLCMPGTWAVGVWGLDQRPCTALLLGRALSTAWHFCKLCWNLIPSHGPLGLPWWLSGKESACSTGSAGDIGLIPGLERFPGGRHGNPLQYSCLENPMDREAWWVIIHWVAKSWTQLKRLSMHTCS